MAQCGGIVDGAYLRSVLDFVDCQAQSLGSLGYQAAVEPGSALSLMLGACLTVFIALWGYRMLLGGVPSLRDGVLSVAKIGIVVTLATSWIAYRTLAYDIVMHGPAELASVAGSRTALPGLDGGLAARLQNIDDSLIALNALGTGPADLDTRAQTVGGATVNVTAVSREPQSFFSPFALGTARLVFLTATIAAFASVRLVAGLLLAIGPFFVALLLFATARTLFEGWVRAIVAAAIGAVGVSVLLAVELALLEPWMTTLLQLRQANLPIGGAPTELLVTALAFALALAAALGMAARIAMGFRIERVWQSLAVQSPGNARVFEQSGAARSELRVAAAEQGTRAAAVAEGVARIQRQEAQLPAGGSVALRSAPRRHDEAAATGAGRIAQGARRARQRNSMMSDRRDARR